MIEIIIRTKRQSRGALVLWITWYDEVAAPAIVVVTMPPSPVHSLAVLEQLWHSLMHPWRGPSVENLQFSCNDYRLFTIQVWMHNSKVQFKDQCCQSQCSNHRGPDDRMGQLKRLVILHLVHSPNMHPVNNRGTSNCQAYSCNVWIKDTFIRHAL